MYFDYKWVKTYLNQAPSLEAAARALNATGLETEIASGGLEIEHTVNRPDAMSHYGVARELSVKLGLDLITPPVYEGEIPSLEGWRIVSDDADECPRYMGLKMDGVATTPSPPWLEERLHAIGQTSHGLLVDLTNFLLWEFGHPSHAFDAETIRGQMIRIREGLKGERLTTLDGRDHDAEGLLCITDADRPIAFAGVMGGENTEVGTQTKNLLLELACFRGVSVRRTGRACQIQSDARHRFERGVDVETMDRVIRRFIYLMLQEQPNAQIRGLLDMNLRPFQRTELVLRPSYLAKIVGIDLPSERVAGLLEAMDFQPRDHPQGWHVAVPGYKVDVNREIDVVEEVIRFAGLDLLRSELPAFQGSDYERHPLREGSDRVRECLRGLGLQEAMGYSFVPETWDRDFGLSGAAPRLRNPMSERQAVMRRLILPNLLDCVRRNLNRGVSELGLFEIGHVYLPQGEPHHLGIVLAPDRDRNHWWQEPAPHPFYAMKGIFEALVDRMGWHELTTRETKLPYLAAGETLGIFLAGNRLGGLGTVASALTQTWDIEAVVVALELDLSFLSSLKTVRPDVKALSPFPAIQMDMAFVLDKDHGYERVRRTILDLDLAHLESLTLFDAYEGKSVGANQRSLGFRFRFRAPDRTLTGEEISQTMDRVVESVKEKFRATIRT